MFYLYAMVALPYRSTTLVREYFASPVVEADQRPHSALGYRAPVEFAASCEPASADEDLTKELESQPHSHSGWPKNGVRLQFTTRPTESSD